MPDHEGRKQIGTDSLYIQGTLRYGFVLLGRLDAQNNSTFILPLEAVLELTDEDSLIVLGESA